MFITDRAIHAFHESLTTTHRTGHRPAARLRRVAYFLTILALTPGVVHAQSIAGHVREDPGRQPIRGAEIRLLSMDGTLLRRVVADTAGGFRLTAPAAGRYFLEAVHLGYTTVRTTRLDVPARRELDVELLLGRTAIPLEPIRVLAVRADNRLSEYYRRADWSERTGAGTVHTRADIERIRAPLARLYVDGVISRVRNDWVAEPRIGCPAETFLNGMPASLTEIDMIDTNELEGVETYVGMDIPPQYRTASGPCAVALFWTRLGGGQAITLPRVVAGVAVVAGILFFAR